MSPSNSPCTPPRHPRHSRRPVRIRKTPSASWGPSDQQVLSPFSSCHRHSTRGAFCTPICKQFPVPYFSCFCQSNGAATVSSPVLPQPSPPLLPSPMSEGLACCHVSGQLVRSLRKEPPTPSSPHPPSVCQASSGHCWTESRGIKDGGGVRSQKRVPSSLAGSLTQLSYLCLFIQRPFVEFCVPDTPRQGGTGSPGLCKAHSEGHWF